MNFFIENEDDELIQTQRKRVVKFVIECSRRPQPQLPEGTQEQKWARTGWIDQPTFIKGIITRLNEKWVHRCHNMTVMSSRAKIVWTNIPQKRVSIPIFDGNKKNYNNWKATFMACVDKTPATAEYKLLQLHQYLSGEAWKSSHLKSWRLNCSLSNCQRKIRNKVWWRIMTNGNLLGEIRKSETSKIW